jgi:hypothetical protein
MTIKATDRETVRRALRGAITEQKRESVARDVSDRVKQAVSETIRRNKKALRELGDY